MATIPISRIRTLIFGTKDHFIHLNGEIYYGITSCNKWGYKK